MRFLIQDHKKNIIKAFRDLKSAENFLAETTGTIMRVFNNKPAKKGRKPLSLKRDK